MHQLDPRGRPSDEAGAAVPDRGAPLAQADGTIRVVALAICFDARGRVLLEHGRDGSRNEDFLRPIGGGVEFGERALDALAREWAEEYRLTLAEPRLVAVVENLYEYEGRPGHEIAFVYTARIVERWAQEQDVIDAVDSDGAPHRAEWIDPAVLLSSRKPCYPPGIVALVDAACGRTP